MKFDVKYPDMTPISDVRGTVMKGKELLPCCVCGAPTAFVDICYEARICSEECMSAMDAEMTEACKCDPESL